jgi:hypothetical protein
MAAAGLTSFLPAPIRVPLIVVILSWLTGEVLRRWLLPAVSGAGRPAVAAVLGLAFHSLLAWLCDIAGIGYTTYTALVQLISLVLFAIATAAHGTLHEEVASIAGGTHRSGADRAAIVTALIVALFFLVLPPTARALPTPSWRRCARSRTWSRM